MNSIYTLQSLSSWARFHYPLWQWLIAYMLQLLCNMIYVSVSIIPKDFQNAHKSMSVFNRLIISFTHLQVDRPWIVSWSSCYHVQLATMNIVHLRAIRLVCNCMQSGCVKCAVFLMDQFWKWNWKPNQIPQHSGACALLTEDLNVQIWGGTVSKTLNPLGV